MGALSDRLAALTRPDREVDAEVWQHLQPEDIEDRFLAELEQADRRATRADCLVAVQFRAPRWTSDLNVVVAEIERRGLAIYLCGRKTYDAGVYSGGKPYDIVRAPTACLALLRALVDAIEAA